MATKTTYRNSPLTLSVIVSDGKHSWRLRYDGSVSYAMNRDVYLNFPTLTKRAARRLVGRFVDLDWKGFLKQYKFQQNSLHIN